MTSAVKQLLRSFDELSTQEQQDVTCELLKRSSSEDYGPLTDDELAGLANETFLELDAREPQDAERETR